MVGFEPAQPVAIAMVRGTIASYFRANILLSYLKVIIRLLLSHMKRTRTSTLTDAFRRHVHTPQFGSASMPSLIISTSLRTTALVPSGGGVICPFRGATAE